MIWDAERGQPQSMRQNISGSYAVDVSEVMIQQAVRKAQSAKISNIAFIHAGFLSYEHQEEPADIVLTRVALHHLPDFWKQVALLRMNAMLKMGGMLERAGFEIVKRRSLQDGMLMEYFCRKIREAASD